MNRRRKWVLRPIRYLAQAGRRWLARMERSDRRLVRLLAVVVRWSFRGVVWLAQVLYLALRASWEALRQSIRDPDARIRIAAEIRKLSWAGSALFAYLGFLKQYPALGGFGVVFWLAVFQTFAAILEKLPMGRFEGHEKEP